MKPFVVGVLFSILTVIQSPAQVALSAAAPAISPTSVSPAITPAPVFVATSPALTPNATSPGVIATNATLVALADSLAVLQTNIQQTLPMLAMFNDNFDFASLGNGLGATPAAAPAGNFSANLATNFANNFAVNAGVPTGGSLFNTVANATPASAAGLPAGLASVPVTRDTLRALLVLQSDMQRMLPVLNALNSGAAGAPGNFTNLFGMLPTTP